MDDLHSSHNIAMFPGAVSHARPRPPSRKPSYASSSSSTSTTRDPFKPTSILDLTAPTDLPLELLSSPATAAAHMLNIDLDRLAATTSREVVTEEWVSERSREELSNLLLEADKVIRERERELSLAAAVGKTLLEKNVSMRVKHDALLARLPVSPPSRDMTTPRPPPQADEWHSDNEQYASTSATPQTFFTPRTKRRSRPQRTRFSPVPVHSPHSLQQAETLALLSDQNASLQAQLEQLEGETSRVDAQGRRKLKKLEMELEGLKRELEDTRVRNGELEERMAKERKEKGKERARVMSEANARRMFTGSVSWQDKGKGRESMDSEATKVEEEHVPATISEILEGGHDHKESLPNMPSADSFASLSSNSTDFHSFPNSPSDQRPRPVSHKSYPATLSVRDPSVTHTVPFPSTGDSPTKPSPSRPHMHRHHSRTVSHDELALVAQLLAKVAELEQANREIVAQRAGVRERLQSATREAEAMEGALREVEDGIENQELEVEGEVEPGVRSAPGSLRLDPRGEAGEDAPTVRPVNKGLLNAPGRVPRGRRKALPRTFMFPARPATPSPSKAAITRHQKVASGSSNSTGSSTPASPTKCAAYRHATAVTFAQLTGEAGSEKDPEKEKEKEADAFGEGDYDLDASLASFMAKMAEVRSLGDELAGQGALEPRPIKRNWSWKPLDWGGDGEDEFEGPGEDGDIVARRTMTPPQVNPVDPDSFEQEEGQDNGDAPRDTVFPPGGLRDAPAEAFDMLYRAIEERPVQWADEDDLTASRPTLLKVLQVSFFGFFTPLEDPATAEDVWFESRPTSPHAIEPRTRRPRPPLPLLNAKLLRATGKLLGDVWLTVLFLWTVMWFLVLAAKKGPAAILKPGADTGGSVRGRGVSL